MNSTLFGKVHWLISFVLIVPIIALAQPKGVPPKQSMNMNYVVEKTLQTSPFLLAEMANYTMNQHRLRRIQGGYFPNVSFRMAYGAEQSDTPALRNQRLSNRSMYPQENRLSLRQYIYDGGRLKNQVKEQAELTYAADHSLTNAKEQVILDAVIAYLDVLQAEQLIVLAKENADLHKGIVDKVKQLYVGKVLDGSKLDLALSRHLQSKSILIKEHETAEQTRAIFVSVTGVAPGRLAPVRFENRAYHDSYQAVLNFILEKNPKIQSSRSSLEASSAAVKASNANFYPDVDMELSTAYDTDVDGIKGRNQSTNAMVVMNYNLYNGGSDAAEKREISSERAKKLNELNHIQRSVEEKAATYWSNLENSQAQQKELQGYVNSSMSLYTAYQEQFRIGKQTLFNVLDAGEQLYRAKVALLQRKYNDEKTYYRMLSLAGELSSTFKEAEHGES